MTCFFGQLPCCKPEKSLGLSETNLLKNIIQKYCIVGQGSWFLLWLHESYFVKQHQHCSFAWCLRISVFYFMKYFGFRCFPMQGKMQKSLNGTEWQLPLAVWKLCILWDVSSLHLASPERLPFLHDRARACSCPNVIIIKLKMQIKRNWEKPNSFNCKNFRMHSCIKPA